MKHMLLIFTLLATVAVTAAPRSLPWSEGVCKAARFESNTSGKLTIADDAKEKAVRFDVEFKAGTDFWVYPFFRLQSHESLVDVEQIRFDIRAEQGNPEAGYRSAYVMIGEEKPYFKMPTPQSEYQTVTINVAEAVKDPSAVKHLRIGMNPKDSKLTFYIRNLEFLTEKKARRHSTPPM